METRQTRTLASQPAIISNARYDSDELTRERLESLLEANAETDRENSLYNSERERFESGLIKSPLTTQEVFSYFGLMLGLFSPAAIFTRVLLDSGSFRGEDSWILGVMAIVNLISAVAGFFSGKLIGKIVRETEKMNWWKMTMLLPFIGILWGVMSGGAGGIIIFVIGAVFGALLGALVGTAALPAFTVLHRLLKKGDLIERNQFLPIAFGITLVICAFILGL